MAEAQSSSAAPAVAPTTASAAASAAEEESDQAPKRPPGVDAANNPEWSMRFLAHVYISASKNKQVVEDLPNWFYPRPEHDLSGAMSYPHNQERDRVLEEVVKDLVAKKKLAEDAAPTAHDRWLLYRQCFTIGTVVIEGRSAYHFTKTTLPTAIRQALSLLEAAAPLWQDLHRAALLVGDRFATTKADRRDADLELTGGGFMALLTGGLSTLFTVQNDAKNLEAAVANAVMAEATRKAAETRLQYAEEALAGAQDKLKEATGAFDQATKQYATVLQNRFSRHVTIDQLRVHVKQNILYYMQAIWDREPSDQRFFRLYNKRVACPKPDPNYSPTYTYAGASSRPGAMNYFTNEETLGLTVLACPPVTLDTKQLVDIADLDNPLGYKGNYIMFPMKGDCYLTDYMLSEFLDDYLGVLDPDGSDRFDAQDFDVEWRKAAAVLDQGARERRLQELSSDLAKYIDATRQSTDEIIVPTGQLFIEALPGSHPLLEDFKLLHRLEDVRKVKSDVRRAELENLRLAARVIAGQENVKLLEDPDVEKKVAIEGGNAASERGYPWR